MALNNIKNVKRNSGFTIVELLIVIVVIAILATISIVAYSGIQQRAKTTKAQANASQVQKIAEAYNADNSKYPSVTADFSNSISKLPASVKLLTNSTGADTSLTSSTTNLENMVDYDYVGTAGAATGGRIQYWDFSTNAISTNIIYVGNADSSSTFKQPAS